MTKRTSRGLFAPTYAPFTLAVVGKLYEQREPMIKVAEIAVRTGTSPMDGVPDCPRARL